MRNLWPTLERISALLDPDERQSVLGDIQERGADLRALLGLLGLVLLRQLQAWRSWQLWALAAALYFPARSAGFHTHPIANMLYSGHLLYYQRGFGNFLIHPWDVAGAVVFAWATGFSLGRLGSRGAASILLLLPVAFAWDIRSLARFTFFANDPKTEYFNFLGPSAARLAWLEKSAYAVALCLMFALVVIPCIQGFRRGLREQPLARAWIFTLAALCLPTVVELFRPVEGASPWRWPMTAMRLWPLVYLLATSRTRDRANRVIHYV
jgi:hypothetical protein